MKSRITAIAAVLLVLVAPSFAEKSERGGIQIKIEDGPLVETGLEYVEFWFHEGRIRFRTPDGFEHTTPEALKHHLLKEVRKPPTIDWRVRVLE